jgi:hypothetical protein
MNAKVGSLTSWHVWYDDGRGLQKFNSREHTWSDIPTKAGIQVILACEEYPYHAYIKGSDWYWWENGWIEAGTQTATAPLTKKPTGPGKSGFRSGVTIDDAVFESYRLAAKAAFHQEDVCRGP